MIAVVDLVAGRFPLRELVIQAWFLLSITVLPALLMAIPFGVIVAVQIGGLTSNLGATSMAGAVGGMGSSSGVRRWPPPCCSAGGRIGDHTADLGARTVREEIDAMRTLGVDPPVGWWHRGWWPWSWWLRCCRC